MSTSKSEVYKMKCPSCGVVFPAPSIEGLKLLESGLRKLATNENELQEMLRNNLRIWMMDVQKEMIEEGTW